MANKKHQIVFIGGGTGTMMGASQLVRYNKGGKLDIAIIEPSETHYYQPEWTLVGAGVKSKKSTSMPMKDVLPKSATWIKDYVADIDADNNKVILRNGDVIEYEYLVVSPGVETRLDLVEGLEEAMGKNGVCSNYIDPDYTWETLKKFKKGVGLFTQPATPIKCPGAPQKIMYLAADYARKNKFDKDIKIVFATPGTMIFGVEPFKTELKRIINDKYDIAQRYGYKLVKVDGEKKEAHYERLELSAVDGKSEYIVNDERNAAGCIGYVWDESGEQYEVEESNHLDEKHVGARYIINYDMMHLAPPMSAPRWFQKTKLANQDGPNKGWMAVDKYSMQSTKYPNVFGLGDVTDVPTAKTGAGVRKQAPVVTDSILNLITGKEISDKKYNGYASCPLVTSYNTMLLAEFGYDGVRMTDPMLPKWLTAKERWVMWIMKRYILGNLYWMLMRRGIRF
ncbi:MAG: FAD/NAD(P)-binding oxidoreductase [Flavobacteriaceae bacterium]